MKAPASIEDFMEDAPASLCDFLILSDGTILSHNLTPLMAEALQVMNPNDETLKQRSALRDRSAESRFVDPCRCP